MAAFGYDRPTFLEEAVLAAPAATVHGDDDSNAADTKHRRPQVTSPHHHTPSPPRVSGGSHPGSDARTGGDGAHVISAAASPLAQPPSTAVVAPSSSGGGDESAELLFQPTGVSSSQLVIPSSAPATADPSPTWQIAGATGFVRASGRPVMLIAAAHTPRGHSAPRPTTWGSQKENEPIVDADDATTAEGRGFSNTTLAIEADPQVPSHDELAVERAMRPVFSGFTTAAGRMVFVDGPRKHAMPAASCPTSPTTRDLAFAESMLSALAVGRPAERGKRSRSRSSGAASPPFGQPTRGQPRN